MIEAAQIISMGGVIVWLGFLGLEDLAKMTVKTWKLIGFAIMGAGCFIVLLYLGTSFYLDILFALLGGCLGIGMAIAGSCSKADYFVFAVLGISWGLWSIPGFIVCSTLNIIHKRKGNRPALWYLFLGSLSVIIGIFAPLLKI